MITVNAKGQRRKHGVEGDADFDMDDGNLGDWKFIDGINGIENGLLLVRVPDGTERGDIAALPLVPQPNDWRGRPVGSWQWDGNLEAPTLTPSILHTKGGWHGYMTKGELISV